MTEKLEQVVSEHAITLGILVNSFSHIEGFMKESIELQKEQAVLIERIANHEERNNGEHQHIHKRIDTISNECINIRKECEEIKDTHQLKCDLLTPSINNGDKAYKALMWILGTLGLMFLTTVYHFIFGEV